jgi:hypothetical protein
MTMVAAQLAKMPGAVDPLAKRAGAYTLVFLTTD